MIASFGLQTPLKARKFTKPERIGDLVDRIVSVLVLVSTFVYLAYKQHRTYYLLLALVSPCLLRVRKIAKLRCFALIHKFSGQVRTLSRYRHLHASTHQAVSGKRVLHAAGVEWSVSRTAPYLFTASNSLKLYGLGEQVCKIPFNLH